MAKLADYFIYQVHYNYLHSRIEKVMCHDDLVPTFTTRPYEFTREQVVGSIEAGNTFRTKYKEYGEWKAGPVVKVVTINYTKYIRTDDNQKEEDNLENLPEY